MPLRVAMQWRDATFLHWRLAPSAAAALLPAGLEPDTFGGDAWVSAVAFRMARTRLLGLPLAPAFPELNLRTYVRRGGVPGTAGIWFLAIDAEGPFVPLGRSQGMPYRRARLRLEHGAVRSEPRAGPPFAASWAPAPEESDRTTGDLDRFLVERYASFGWRRGRLVRSDVEHARWRLERARATVTAWGSLPAAVIGRQPDLAHASPGVGVRARRAVPA